MDANELFNRSIQQITKATRELQDAVKALGTGGDAAARDRLRRQRLIVHQCAMRVAPALGSSSQDQEGLHCRYQEVMTAFELADADALRREKQIFPYLHTTSDTPSEQDDSSAQVRLQDIRPVDVSELYTDELMKRETFMHVREIESDVMDLRATYREFHHLVSTQQEGLDEITNNVSESIALLDRGRAEIQEAARYQRSNRWFCCLFCAVLLSVVVGVPAVLKILD